MKTVMLASGREVAALGQGTWNMGDDPATRRAEVYALQLGIDLGMTLIDTAEMYGDGGAEQVVGAAIAGRREHAFVVTKVCPYHADAATMRVACERSLRHLGTDYIDLYLLHWRGMTGAAATLDAFRALQREGKIRAFGVSNFNLRDLAEWQAAGPGEAAANQIIYNLVRRGAESDVLPWSRAHGMPVMAYSPLESFGPGRAELLANPALVAVAARHGCTSAQAALAWLLHQPGVIVIPKARSPLHVRENAGALAVTLDAADFAQLDAAFPPGLGWHPNEVR